MNAENAVLATPTVSELVRAARTGERDAMQGLYQRFAAAVHGCLLSYVVPQDADDLVQDVFTTVFHRLQTLREDAAFPGWIMTITRNLALAHLRAPRPGGVDALTIHSDRAAPDTVSEAGAVLNALARLPDKYREVLILRLVEGMSGPEIAECTGLTHGTVRVYLHEGMQRLRGVLSIARVAGVSDER